MRSSSKTLLVVCGVWWFAAAPGFCAETADPSSTETTVLTLTLDSAKPVDIRTRFQDQPPTLTIEFQKQRVVGSLPERSAIQEGAVQTILTQYYSGADFQPSRFIRSLQIIFTGPYAYRVRSEPGRIVVAVDHPASVGRGTLEVGLKGGTIIRGLRERSVSERFRAMQDALNSATPSRWTWQIPFTSEGASTPASAPPAAAPEPHRPSPAVRAAAPGRPMTQVPSAGWWSLALLAGIAVAGGWAWRRPAAVRAILRREPSLQRANGRLPSGVALIEELIWQAFERQGYQLVQTIEGGQPAGLLRLVTKDGSKAALQFVWNGHFFEKRTVEQFAGAMRQVGVGQGFLMASGSFTVPAQRVAKERGITLIGREQIMELLSAGASSEYFTKQVEQLHARVEESKVTLQEYANQFDTLRRQRNEASWYLGEERAKTSQLEGQLTDAEQHLRHREAELSQWTEEAAAFRKRWEESQWYLGESRARIRHLEAYLGELQEAVKRLETAEREQGEANWYLGEARQRVSALEQQLASAEGQLAASLERERTLQNTLDDLKRTLGALQAYGERRRMARAHVPDAQIELLDGADQAPLFVGSLRDLSSRGIGLETDRALPEEALRIRLRLPGAPEPIISRARVVWQQETAGIPARFHSGCRLLGLPDAVRSRIAEVIEHTST